MSILTHSDLQHAGAGIDSGFTREIFDSRSTATPFGPIPTPPENPNATAGAVFVSDVQSTSIRENSMVMPSLDSAATPPSSLSGKLDFMIAIVRDIQTRQIQLQHVFEQLSATRSSNIPIDEMELEDFGMPIDTDESMAQLSTMLKEKRDRMQLVCPYFFLLNKLTCFVTLLQRSVCRYVSVNFSKLRWVKNSLAKVVLKRRKFDHITPSLVELHWLPIRQRTTFKLATLTYKLMHSSQPHIFQTP